jgi:hypothetical protein
MSVVFRCFYLFSFSEILFILILHFFDLVLVDAVGLAVFPVDDDGG